MKSTVNEIDLGSLEADAALPLDEISGLSENSNDNEGHEQQREDRIRLLNCAWRQNDDVGAFCLVLMHTGCRISEALALRWMDIEAARGSIAFKSLQQRGVTRIRRVPAPPALMKRLLDLRAYNASSFDTRIWSWSRVTAWRRMRDFFQKADVSGSLASPQGLRTSFARTALDNGVPLDIICRWLGISHLKVDHAYDQDAPIDDTVWTDIIWSEQNDSRLDSKSGFSRPAGMVST